MVTDITPENYRDIPNAAFRRYAQVYADIQRDFIQAILSFGLEMEPEREESCLDTLNRRAARLAELGVAVENDRKSFHVGWISPSCVTCRKGIGTETFLSSTQCPRDCFFCFNPNQADYDYYRSHVHDMASELQGRLDAGVRYTDLAVTGGEPLIHAQETIAFFRLAHEACPNAYTRLYTSGSGLTPAVLYELEQAGLQEIRFSVKLEDPQGAIEKTFERMAACVGRIPQVMVEMPVMPDQVEQMKGLIARMDEIGCSGINLLELCFPFNNADEFAKRGYRLKELPYRVLYDYWYSGGLPIAGSEETCLDLLEWAAGAGLRMGVHYCSLENKNTGQVYQQNRHIPAPHPRHAMSPRDHFLKVAKVFGADRDKASAILRAAGVRDLVRDKDASSLEFPLEQVGLLARECPDMPVAVSIAICEERDGMPVLRELALQLTTPATFDLQADF